MKKTVLITGILGQDGYYLSKLLLSKNNKIIGIDTKDALKLTNQDDFKGIELIGANLLDLDSLSTVIKKYQPDEIYNLASQSMPGASWRLAIETGETNGLGAHRLFEIIRQIKPSCRIYQASSSEIFGKVLQTPQNENTPCNPVNPYAAAKLYAHNIARIYRDSFKMFISCGILFNHESPRRPMSFVMQKIAYAAACLKHGIMNSAERNEFGEPIVKDGKVLVGNLDAKRDFGFAGDYVEAMWMMLQCRQSTDFVIGTGELRTVRNLCQEAFACAGLDWEKYIIVDPRFMRPIETGDTVADISKAKLVLGWHPKTSFKELVAMMVENNLTHLK